jgi:hypothetical protein
VPGALVRDEHPGVSVDRREAQAGQPELLASALGVVELGDGRAVEPYDPQRRVHRVTVLGVLYRDQRAVARQIADSRRLPVPVYLHRLAATGPNDVKRRALLVR